MYLVHLTSAVENLTKHHPNDVIWIWGDAVLSDIDLPSNTVSRSSDKRDIGDIFLQVLENCGLDQIVDFLTRDNNLLDNFLTNRPSLIQICRSLPGISDHVMVQVD